MPKATDASNTTTAPATQSLKLAGQVSVFDTTPEVALGQFGSAMDQIHLLVNQSYDKLLTAEGELQPDYKLLGLCDDTLHAWKQHTAAWDRIRKSGKTPAEDRPEIDAAQGWQNKAMRNARELSKLKATTTAGLYAKAMVVRFSRGSAAVLSISLAEDFLACPGLRESLWPAGRGEG